MPKLTVITNAAGDIVGTASFTGDKGAPTGARVLGGPGTRVEEIDVPEDDLRLSAGELHMKLQKTYLSTVRLSK